MVENCCDDNAFICMSSKQTTDMASTVYTLVFSPYYIHIQTYVC